jgi:hypothetical protein
LLLQAPAMNHRASQKAMNDTFSLSNISPQVRQDHMFDLKPLLHRSRKRKMLWRQSAPPLPHSPRRGGGMCNRGANQVLDVSGSCVRVCCCRLQHGEGWPLSRAAAFRSGRLTPALPAGVAGTALW